MITTPPKAFGAIDRSEPTYPEPDAEKDAEHARWVAGLNYKAPERDPRWDAVDAKRKAEQNKHVHPLFRDVLKKFG